MKTNEIWFVDFVNKKIESTNDDWFLFCSVDSGSQVRFEKKTQNCWHFSFTIEIPNSFSAAEYLTHSNSSEMLALRTKHAISVKIFIINIFRTVPQLLSSDP